MKPAGWLKLSESDSFRIKALSLTMLLLLAPALIGNYLLKPTVLEPYSCGEELTHTKQGLHCGTNSGGEALKGLAPLWMGQKLDLNQVGAEELQVVPGIGPALAERVLAYRQEKGPFRSFQQLDEVKGIGPKLLARMKPWLKVQAPQKAPREAR